MIVSDHGMMNIGDGQAIYIDDFIELNSLIVPPVGLGFISRWPKQGMEETLYARLLNARPHLHVMRPKGIPERFHCCDEFIEWRSKQ